MSVIQSSASECNDTRNLNRIVLRDDGINTVVPIADEGYTKHRRELALPFARLHKINNDVSLHFSMKSMAHLLQDGRMAIVQGVGYPNPDRSHDVSMAIWQTARLGSADHKSFGWIGRAMDKNAIGNSMAPSTMFIGEESLPVAIQGRKSAFAAMNRLTDLQRMPGRTPRRESSSSSESTLANSSTDDLTAFVQRTTLDAYAISDALAEIVNKRQQIKLLFGTRFCVRFLFRFGPNLA